MTEPAPAETEALARYRAAARRRAGTAAQTPGNAMRRRLLRPLAGTPSGPGPDARDPQRVGAVWRSLADTAGWTGEMAVWSLANRWVQIVGPQVAEHVVVVAFESSPAQQQGGRRTAAPQQGSLLGPPPAAAPSRGGGKLTLQADSNSWQQQMIWNLPLLQRRLDEELGPAVVASVVVLGPSTGRRGSPRSRR